MADMMLYFTNECSLEEQNCRPHSFPFGIFRPRRRPLLEHLVKTMT